MRISFKARWICFLFTFLFCTLAEAQNFEKLNGPYGGGSKVYEGKNGVLFQIFKNTSSSAVIYKSDDDGLSWLKMPATPVSYALPVVGLDGNLYCTVSNTTKIYKSSDDGLSWILMKPLPIINMRSMVVLPDGTILISTITELYRSSNNGLDWQRISNVDQIEYFFYNAQKFELYAMSRYKLYISKDKGLNWEILYSDNFGYNEKNLVVASNGSVLVSGENFIWKFDSTGKFIFKTEIFPNSWSPIEMGLSASGRLFATKYYRCMYSDDLGETWSDLILPSEKPYVFESYSTTSSGILFAVKDLYGGLFRSTDNGKNWTFSSYGINQAAIIELDYISESKLLVLTADGLFYSEDSGANWSFLIEAFGVVGTHNQNHVVNYGEEFYFAGYNGIYYFKDWKTKPTLIRPKTDLLWPDMLYMNSVTGTLFLQDKTGLNKSKDKGTNWKKVPLLQTLRIYGFYTFPDGSIIVVNGNGIYKSINDGDKWDLVFVDNSRPYIINSKILGNSYSGAYMIFEAISNYKLASTIDYGASWDVTDLDIIDTTSIFPDAYGQAVNNLDYLYIGGSSGEIFRSIDFGNTLNLYSKIENLKGLSISPDQKLYAFTFGDGLYRSTTETTNSKVLRGNVFRDLDFDCERNGSELGTEKRLVIANNGTSIQSGFTRVNGNFAIPLENGSYELHVVTNNNYWSSCAKTISTANYDLNDTLKLGLQANLYCPFLIVDIQSSWLRRCFESTLYISYSNTGTLKAENAYVDVTLDPFLEFISSSIPFVSQNGNVYRFLLGDVDENTSGAFTIEIKVSCNSKLGQIHCAEAHIYPDTTCILTSQAIIRTNANCLGDSINLIIRNAGNKNMSTSKKWAAIDQSNSGSMIQNIDEGSFYLNAGQVFNKKIASKDKVLLIAEQDDSYPNNKTSQTEIISCSQNPQPGSIPLNINIQDEEESFISKFCEPNRGSFDPNDITGYPQGITDKKYIGNSQQLEYIIRFQNTGTDTAFNVRIENELSTKELNIATLNLGAASHPYEFTLNPNGKLIFTFKHILLPDSSINEKASHGFIHYSIKPVDKLSNGTKILNDASIYFDFNDGVNTNVDFHTIGNPVIVKVKEVNEGEDVDFQIEPNPMQQSSVITINDFGRNQKYQLSCLDVHSKEMWKMDVTGNRANISKREMRPGVYILALKSNNGILVTSKKVIVE
jgi:photosystem II stability/assembly factor-like uncharacterized protein